MNEISMPILNLLDTMWGYLPNILAAVIVLWVGVFVAKLVRELLIPIFNKMKINRLQEMAGIEAADSAKLSDTLAYVVYVLILIPVIITALQALDISAVSETAIKMLDIIFGFIPNIIVALIIIVVGSMLARLSGNIVENLTASAGLDIKLAKLMENENRSFILSKVIGKTVHVVMVVFFIVESFGVLHLQVLNNIGNAVISYMPYVLLCKCAIYILGGFMVFNELGIASEIVNTAFILIIAALAVAFAVAFGVGGRDFAGRTLRKLEDKCSGGQKEDKA